LLRMTADRAAARRIRPSQLQREDVLEYGRLSAVYVHGYWLESVEAAAAQ